ncbi:class I SAM-dependent methyltransferase [Fusibacter tunisiensis]|uniref:SAM-dependent methyltransferase n=1 Tax=Fusibacter tunisiensis TaxID=1008308 RepID=A0ABS2MPB5_9FIRM|nr:SAM-dependent methyltransferase [Fusibacter tunisiensis]MBM7561237.1 SAM-dependent methyltransferase [Fusibacter tunisiensis]
MKQDLYKSIKNKELILGVVSNLKKGIESAAHKIEIRPVTVQDEFKYQVTSYVDSKVFHDNMDANALISYLENLLGIFFRQGVFFTSSADYQILYSKKMKEKILKKPPSKFLTQPTHNRVKRYLIPEGEPCDFMVYLGVMDASGKVFKKRYDKFRQLNKYLEFVSDSLKALDLSHKIRIVDFGCGKAYLTFALYYYLVTTLKLDVEIVGLDLKADVIEFCNETANALNYKGLIFKKGDIRTYNQSERVDMVVSLHACDTATDAALVKAVEWGAGVIFAVPCCQHELFKQIDHPAMMPLLKHGVVKDKLVTLVTDTLRATALESRGYEVQLLEFIDLAHTPKNILIRAYKSQGTDATQEKALETYKAFKREWHVEPAIEALIEKSNNKL